jgi:hypothetical protein
MHIYLQLLLPLLRIPQVVYTDRVEMSKRLKDLAFRLVQKTSGTFPINYDVRIIEKYKEKRRR